MASGHGQGRGARTTGRRKRRRKRLRDDDGQFVQTIGGNDVLAVFDNVAGPVVTTTDVADGLGITTEAARRKLNRLVSDGELCRRKTGRTVVYWRADGRGDGTVDSASTETPN